MEPVAYQLFTDCTHRPAFDDGQRQWVEDDDGQRVYGVWCVPRENCDTPIFIDDLPADW